MIENRRLLLERFGACLFERCPERVLDLGCGSGALLAACAERELPAIGLDVEGDSLAAARAAGHEVVAGIATDLPWAEAEFDWVALRHVVHHLEQPVAALREAWRVARSGLIVAEPWYDADDPAHQPGLALDLFLRSFHRRNGMFHAADFDAAALRALLPATGVEITVESFHPGRCFGSADIERLASSAVGELELSAAERQERDELIATAARGELPQPGTLIVIATPKPVGI